MAAQASYIPTTLTTKNQPFPASSSAASSPSSGSASAPASVTSSLLNSIPNPTITSFPTLTPSGNGTANTTTATFSWDCSRTANSKESVFINFSGCTYASATPTAKPSNGTTNGTLSGTPPPTAGSGVRSASGVEMGSFAALGLVLVAMMGWL